jgi:transcriptional regulator with XRE-family HTH domain
MGLLDVFAVNMRKYRKNAGITQEKLAELCRTDPAYIGQIETGRRCPSLEYVERIAGALNIAPHVLFYDESAPADERGALGANQKHLIQAILSDCVTRVNSVMGS